LSVFHLTLALMRARGPAYIGLFVGLCLGFVLSVSSSTEAARNSSGTYSLPTGNPVVTGTVISSTTYNNTQSDIATEMTDSLNRSGKGGMLAVLKGVDGADGGPMYSFTNDTDTGVYRITTNQLGFSTGGVTTSLTSTQATFPGSIGASGSITGTDGGFTGSCSITGALVVADGIGVTRSSSNSTGITIVGSGTGAGGSFFGGSTSGTAVVGLGGASNGYGANFTGDGTGSGVVATGGDSSGIGVNGIGGASNGIGVKGEGVGSGAGVKAEAVSTGIGLHATASGSGAGIYGSSASGTGYGIIAEADGTSPAKAALRLVPQDADPSTCDNGALIYSSATNKFRGCVSGVWTDLH
jgi:hypothetical protein